MSNISQRHSHCKLGAFAENTLNIDRAVVLQDNTFGDGETESCAANLSGSGFIYSVETIIDLVEGVLRNSDAGIFHTDVEVIGIRVDSKADFAVIPIVFDGVFHKICDDHCHLGLIDLRVYFSHADHSQLNITLLRNGPDPSQDQLAHLIDIALLNIEFGVLAVHTDKSEKLCNDLVLSVHFVLDIFHELAVHLNRDIIHLKQRIGQNFHGSHRRLELMGYVGDKFLPGFIKRVHSRQYLIKRIRNMFRFQERRRFNGIG